MYLKPLNKKAMMPGTGNLANYQELVRSITLTITILKGKISILIPTAKHNSHPLSKFLFASDADRHRKPQLVKMKRTTDHGVHISSAYIYISLYP